jgi:hypothetical protein
LEAENGLKMLRQQFPTANQSEGPTSKIVVENQRHPAFAST